MVSLLSTFAVRALISRRDSAHFCYTFRDGRHRSKCSGGSHVDESGTSFKDAAKICLIRPLSEGRVNLEGSRLEDLDDGF